MGLKGLQLRCFLRARLTPSDFARHFGQLPIDAFQARVAAATVPTRWPERIAWAINHHYHDTPGGHVRIYRQHELEAKLERAGFYLRGSHRAHAFHSAYWWLKCAYGLDNTEAAPVKRYHEFLCILIERNPKWARVTEGALNPVLGKSVVLYGEKVPASMSIYGKRSLDGA